MESKANQAKEMNRKEPNTVKYLYSILCLLSRKIQLTKLNETLEGLLNNKKPYVENNRDNM